ncbi:MAG: enoyl-CoA hydratase/isomerase family protein [Gammaproteobacteria bacterium]
MNADYQHILYEVRHQVAHVVLNRPEKLNAMGAGPGSSRAEIAHALDVAAADDGVGAVLISANGRAFCGGGDLARGGEAAAPPTPLDHLAFNQEIVRFNAGLRAVPKPVIAAVHGLCVGTALGFISQLDFVIAADDARFGLIEGRIGHPGASDLVPVIGAAWTRFLIYTGELIDAAQAERIGLVLIVVPRAQLLERATDLAERLARMPREALRLNKLCIENVLEASGRAAGRLAGRAHDAITLSMAGAARAPDGRRFEEILAREGIEGVKQARAQQYSEPWLQPPHDR